MEKRNSFNKIYDKDFRNPFFIPKPLSTSVNYRPPTNLDRSVFQKLWWQHVLPSIKPDITNFSNEMPSAALQPFITVGILSLTQNRSIDSISSPLVTMNCHFRFPFHTKMLQLAEPDEVQEYMLPTLSTMFSGCALR